MYAVLTYYASVKMGDIFENRKIQQIVKISGAFRVYNIQEKRNKNKRKTYN